MNEFRDKVSSLELLKVDPSVFGLKLENSNDRRSIFSVQDRKVFLNRARDLNIGVPELTDIEKYLQDFPNALVQFFVVNKPEDGKKIRLGDHYHTSVEEGGSGNEVFIFTEVPSETHIKLEQYHLGKAKGELRYDIKSGGVMKNSPTDYHVFTADGPFQMVQILEGDFEAKDLKKFDVEQWTKGDENIVNGHGAI